MVNSVYIEKLEIALIGHKNILLTLSCLDHKLMLDVICPMNEQSQGFHLSVWEVYSPHPTI